MMTRGPVPSRRAVEILAVIVLVFVAASAGWGINRALGLSDAVADLQATTNAQDSALSKANQRLESEGLPPVDVPEVPEVADGAAGAAGVDGEDGEDGQDGADSIVRGPSCVEQLGLERCRGTRGAPGQDGADGANSTVPGPEGRTGPAGQDSTVPGPAGPPGSAGAKGDPGTNGSDGAPGKDGAPGTAKPGTYTCPAGQAMYGFTVTEAGDVTLDCRDDGQVLP